MLIFFPFLLCFSIYCQNIVYVSLSSKSSDYLSISINQVHKSNPYSQIFIIHNERQENIKNLIKTKFIFPHLVRFVDYELLDEKKCAICLEILDSVHYFHKNNMYYTNTIKRYIALFLLMKKLHLTNAFHIESDVMIYGNFQLLLKNLIRCNAKLSFPGKVGSILFMDSPNTGINLLKEFLIILTKWKTRQIAKMHINDMHLLSIVKSRKVSKYLELPSNPYISGNNCILNLNPNELFDPSFFGQALGGLPSNPGVPYLAKSAFFTNISDVYEISENGRKSFYYKKYFLFNLHIHSKKLKDFE